MAAAMMARNRVRVLVPLLVILGLLPLQSAQETQLGKQRGFCQRYYGGSTACRTPPTVDTVDLSAYLGTWYEIGSTADFKFVQENGLICITANYSIIGYSTDGLPKIRVINRGLIVAPPELQAVVSNISTNAIFVTSSTTAICRLLSSNSALVQALQSLLNLSTTLDSESRSKIQGFTLDIDNALLELSPLSRAIYKDIQTIMSGTDELMTFRTQNQSLVTRRISTRVDKILLSVEAIKNITLRVTGLVGQLQTVSSLDEVKNSAATLAKVAGFGGNITGLAYSIATFSGILKTAVEGLTLPVTPITAPTTVIGTASPKLGAKGKLAVAFGPVPGPYWIIGLYGNASSGYDEAVVYSCEPSFFAANEITMYLLSRKPTVPASSFERFNALVKKYRLFVGGSNPFTLTVQDEARCALYLNSVQYGG